jgi:uncharacterized membrane protein
MKHVGVAVVIILDNDDGVFVRPAVLVVVVVAKKALALLVVLPSNNASPNVMSAFIVAFVADAVVAVSMILPSPIRLLLLLLGEGDRVGMEDDNIDTIVMMIAADPAAVDSSSVAEGTVA